VAQQRFNIHEASLVLSAFLGNPLNITSESFAGSSQSDPSITMNQTGIGQSATRLDRVALTDLRNQLVTWQSSGKERKKKSKQFTRHYRYIPAT
jgi:hypothetical protein